MSPLEPIPETLEAVDELDPTSEATAFLHRLVRAADRGRTVVPDLVGVSIARAEHGLTFTLVATAEEIAALDGVQYVAGGPCVDGADIPQVREFESDDLLDEERWQLFSAATAARGIRSTLTLPIVTDDRVVGTVNLYAASGRAFAEHHDELARIFGAVAAGAVANADLSFTTRREAEQAPARAREMMLVEVATGILAAQLRVDVDAAGERLRRAAEQAGISVGLLALHIVEGRAGADSDEL